MKVGRENCNEIFHQKAPFQKRADMGVKDLEIDFLKTMDGVL